MKFSIKEYEKKYEFTLENVAQLCGQNIPTKTYILESLRRYFGTYKYSEERNPWRDNVFIDEELPGRKYFDLISITNRNDLVSMINMSKQSLMFKFLKNYLQNFECQKSLNVIDDELLHITSEINNKLQEIGSVQLEYSMVSLWEMVQKTNLVGKEYQNLDVMKTSDLLGVLLGLIEKLSEDGKRYLVIIENIDHMISVQEYKLLYEKMFSISMRYNTKFLCSISLDGYPIVNKDNLQEICVINDIIFQFPDAEMFSEFVLDYYPVYIHEIDENLWSELKQVIHKIAKEDYLVSQKRNVILKLLNSSILLPQKLLHDNNPVLQSFLEG